MNIVPLTVPLSGLISEEGYLEAWLKSEGDHVESGEEVCVIEFEKASVSVEAPMTGTVVALLFKEGETIAVGAEIARIQAD